jgi:hypothetical protein
VLDYARLYVADGISVIPIMPDGSKSPALTSWKVYQTRLPTPEELQRWFAAGLYGIAILAGHVSGDLEILDFDDGPTFQTWAGLLAQHRLDVLERLPRVATPGGGFHVPYRLPYPPEGSRKLAQRQVLDPSTGKRALKTLIEIKGEGGYVLAPGSPPACHQTGRPYVFVPNHSLPPIPCLRGDLQ